MVTLHTRHRKAAGVSSPSHRPSRRPLQGSAQQPLDHRGPLRVEPTASRHADVGSLRGLGKTPLCINQADRVKTPCRNGNKQSYCAAAFSQESFVRAGLARRPGVSQPLAAVAFSHNPQEFRSKTMTLKRSGFLLCKSAA